MSGVEYYPIYSGGQNLSVTSGGWTSYESSSFTDQNTGNTIDSGKRYQCITIDNIGSVGVVFTFGNTSTIVSASAADAGYRVAAGETKRIEVFSLGGSTGVKYVGLQTDPTLEAGKVGPVLIGSVFLYAEFGNQ